MFKLKLLFFFPSIGVLVLIAGFCFVGPFLSSADISISSYFFLLMVCILLFVSGIQLLCMGIIGQYLAKTYLETKKRPIYIIKETEKDL